MTQGLKDIISSVSCEAEREDWSVLQKPYIRDNTYELQKPGLIFLKGAKALMVDVTDMSTVTLC